jgi:DNA-binding response OmpR family regulator
MTDFSDASRRILIIDDDQALQNLVVMMLNRVGLQAWVADTAVEGMEILRTEDFGLLILDLMLPDIDGFEVLGRLRKDQRYEQMPILILSARAETEAISRGFDLGADGYLTKPYLPNSLTERVRTLLTQGRRRPSSPAQPDQSSSSR